MKLQTQMLFKNRRSSGFTLVELMVVILIIVVLAGLLFPLAQNMREGATRTKCVAQFRTWATAISAYAGDNSGRYEVANVAPVSYAVQDCTPYIEYWAPGLNKVDEENYERTPTFDEAVKIHREMRCCPTLDPAQAGQGGSDVDHQESIAVHDFDRNRPCHNGNRLHRYARSIRIESQTTHHER